MNNWLQKNIISFLHQIEKYTEETVRYLMEVYEINIVLPNSQPHTPITLGLFYKTQIIYIL